MVRPLGSVMVIGFSAIFRFATGAPSTKKCPVVPESDMTYSTACFSHVVLKIVPAFGSMYVFVLWQSWSCSRSAVLQLSPHSAVGRPGPRSGAAPGRLSQGRTQRVPDGHPIRPQYSHTVSAKHSSAMGAGACSRENNLSASHHDEAQSYVPPENIPGLTPKHAGSGLSTRSMHRSNETLVSSFYIKADA